MYPDLSYFFHDVFNTPLDNAASIFKTYGLFLALAFLAAAFVVYLELKRKEHEGVIKPLVVTKKNSGEMPYTSILINALIGFILGFKLFFILGNFDAFKADGAGVVFSTDGNWPGGLIFGLLYGGYTFWNWRKNKKTQQKETTVTIHPYEKTGDITIIAAISGIVGARLFSILENLDLFFQDPLGQIFSGSGLTVYGGLIVAFIVVYFYIKKLGIPVLHMMDIAGMAIILGYGIGRLGCHFSGDGDWGIVNEMAKPAWFILPDWMWSYDYPHNVINEGVPIAGCTAKYCNRLDPGVFPTSVYETIASTLIFIFLWIMRKRIKIAGFIFFMYLVFNGVERFLIETIRVNDKYNYFGFEWSQAQYISVVFVIIGIAGMYFLFRKNKYSIKGD